MNKTLATTLLAAACWAAPAGPATAALIEVFVSGTQPRSNLAAVRAAAAEWYAARGLAPIVTENFESHQAGTRGTVIDTRVGTFTGTVAGQSTSGLSVMTNTGFGRYNTTEGGANWLDSKDYRTVTWDLDADGATVTHIGFILMDMNDNGARLTLNLIGEALGESLLQTVSAFPQALSDGSAAFVGISLEPGASLSQLVFSTGRFGSDGWGIDDVVLAKVPEPGTLWLIGSALLAVGLRRRRSIGCTPSS